MVEVRKMNTKKLENGRIWGEEVYIVRSKPKKIINPAHKMGTWCGHNITLTEDRFGKIPKGTINKLKKRIKKRLEGQEELSSKELDEIGVEKFYNKNEKYLKYYIEDKKKLEKRFNNIIKNNRIETKLVKNYEENLFYIRVYASHSVLLALLGSSDRDTTLESYSNPDYSQNLGIYHFWKRYFKNEKIDDKYFEGWDSDTRYFDICFQITKSIYFHIKKEEKELESFIKIPLENRRKRTSLSYGHGFLIKEEYRNEYLNVIHPNKRLLVNCLGFDLELYCKELLEKQDEIKKEEEKLRAEENEILEKVERDEELLKIIVENASLEFLNETIRPIIFKRLGISLEVNVSKLKTMAYKDYLKTDHWKEVSRKAKMRADYKCQLCGYDKSLQVHHNDYSRRGKELPSDLIVLCKTCHGKFHDKI